MKIAEAVKYVDQRIQELEKQIYVTDTVVLPRHEEDKKILRQMREQRVKMAALQEKMDSLNARRAKGEIIPREEEIATDDVVAALPPAFR